MLLLTFSSAFFLSASAPSTAPSSEFTGNTLMVIGQVITLAVAIGGFLLAMRRQPPIAEEMHETFVRREEWDQSGQRLHARVDETHKKIDALGEATSEKIDHLAASTAKGFQDTERALGRIEGAIKTK